MKKKLPDDLMSLFILGSNVHSTNQALNSAINNLIHIPRFDTVTYSKNSIKFYCVQVLVKPLVARPEPKARGRATRGLTDIEPVNHPTVILTASIIFNRMYRD